MDETAKEWEVSILPPGAVIEKMWNYGYRARLPDGSVEIVEVISAHPPTIHKTGIMAQTPREIRQTTHHIAHSMRGLMMKPNTYCGLVPTLRLTTLSISLGLFFSTSLAANPVSFNASTKKLAADRVMSEASGCTYTSMPSNPPSSPLQAAGLRYFQQAEVRARDMRFDTAIGSRMSQNSTDDPHSIDWPVVAFFIFLVVFVTGWIVTATLFAIVIRRRARRLREGEM